MFCGLPSSSTVKSSRLKSVISFPERSFTVTSRTTRLVLDLKNDPRLLTGSGQRNDTGEESFASELHVRIAALTAP